LTALRNGGARAGYNCLMKRYLAPLLLLCAVTTAQAQSLTAEGGWIRSAPPGAKVMAGYVRLSNPGDTELRLVEARSSAFETIEFHETVEQAGVARMRPVDALVLVPGATVNLEPGGLHLMLIGPRRKLMLGDSVVVDMLTADGEALPLVLRVSSMPAADGHDHSQHDHSRHGDSHQH
jgi:periplasmic copper chaperone A